jgi:hypothetical protein
MGVLWAALLLGLAQAAPAAAPPAASAAEDVPTRTVSFWAMGDKGEAVEGLTTDEVVVMEDGVARVVTRVARDTRPLTVAIVVDSSGPLASVYRLNVVEPVAEFVGQLPPGTRYALWTTGDRPRKAVDFTDDRARAVPALRKTFPTGGNTLFDALTEAAEDLEKREGERTMLVAITGVGIGFSSHSRQGVVDAVRKSGVPVMAVQYEEKGSDDFQAAGADQVTRADYDYVLGSLTKGGVFERPVSAMGLGTSLRKMAAALSGFQATYALDDAGRKANKVEVQIARPGVKARVVGGLSR